jgi:hypothetical protein
MDGTARRRGDVTAQQEAQGRTVAARGVRDEVVRRDDGLVEADRAPRAALAVGPGVRRPAPASASEVRRMVSVLSMLSMR